MIINSPGYRFRRGTGSPFDALPHADFGSNTGIPCQWCHFCKQSVETNVVRPNQAEVWGFKQTCRRCGRVTASAIYYQVADLTPNRLLEKAQQWMNEPEKKA